MGQPLDFILDSVGLKIGQIRKNVCAPTGPVKPFRNTDIFALRAAGAFHKINILPGTIGHEAADIPYEYPADRIF